MIKNILLLLFLPAIVQAQEHARILDHSVTYTIDDDVTASIEEYYKVQVNSDKARRFMAYLGYVDKYHKVADVSMQISDMNGKKMKHYYKTDGREIGLHASYEISDAKYLVIPTDYQNYPYILEINSKIKLNGFISLPPWNPRDQFNMGVDRSVMKIKRPPNVKIKFREVNVKAATSSIDGNMVVSQYEVSNLPPVEARMRFQDFYNEQPKVLLSPDKFKLDDMQGYTTSWADFGNWYLKLNNTPYELEDDTKKFIDQLNKSDKDDFIRKLYVYMQNRTRYISIQLGIGGFKSLPTKDVEKFGYGDCKALSTYMKNMLDYAGVKSNYVLARAGNDVPDVIGDFPSNQFNHVYIGVPLAADTVYLECTSQTTPSGYTGTFTDDRNVLWVVRDRSKIIRSKIYDFGENQKNSTVDIQLDGLGNSSVKFDVENDGVFFDEIMIYQSANPDYQKTHNEEKFTYSDFSIKEFSYQQPDKSKPSFKAKYLLQVTSLAKVAGSRLIVPGVPTIPLRKFVTQDEMMKFCAIKRGMTITDEIELNLPENYWLYKLPEKENIDSKFGSYALSVEMDGSKLKIKRVIVLYKGDYTKASYDEFRAFYLQMEKLDDRKLVLNSKT